jgi:arylsulfatase A-like enzyme
VWPKTWPSIATLLTGLYPQRTGVTQVRQHLALELTTLAEIFARASYTTAAVVANFNVGTVFGFDQGYTRFVESWQARWSERQGGVSFGRQHAIDIKDYTNATIVTDQALELLGDSGVDSPFFLWLHYIDPHGPYLPPERYRELFDAAHPPALVPAVAMLPGYQLQHDRESGAPITDLAHYRAQYDREIRYLDDEIGRLFAGLGRRGLDNNTLVVLVADHGESLGEHGYYLEHGKLSYQVNAHVPLIVSQPGVIPESRIDWPVGVIDIAPTLLELAGLPIPAVLEGTSLAGLIRGNRDARGPEHVFMGSGYRPNRPQLTVRSGTWKLIHVRAPADRLAMKGSRFELYDLSTDPGELHNLAAENPERVERLGKVLKRWYGNGFPAVPQPGAPLKPHEKKMLRQLGYLGEEP